MQDSYDLDSIRSKSVKDNVPVFVIPAWRVGQLVILSSLGGIPRQPFYSAFQLIEIFLALSFSPLLSRVDTDVDQIKPSFGRNDNWARHFVFPSSLSMA
jgi:hypothetical protein